MLKEEYVERILDECYVQYFLSSSYDGGRIEWPWRMFPPKEVYPRYVDITDIFIVDSDFSDPDVTNKDVLDKAQDVGADIAVLEDVYQEYAPTVSRVLKGLELADDHTFDGEIMVPLQAPYTDCYKELGEPERVAIGGLKDAPARKKVETVKRLREYTGSDTHIHGLGWGATNELVNAVRKNPDLIDSIDSQTAAANTRSKDFWMGDEQSTPIAAWTLGNLLEACRRMSPLGENPNGENGKLSQWANDE